MPKCEDRHFRMPAYKVGPSHYVNYPIYCQQEAEYVARLSTGEEVYLCAGCAENFICGRAPFEIWKLDSSLKLVPPLPPELRQEPPDIVA